MDWRLGMGKFKEMFRQMMSGRYGVDELNNTLLLAGITLNLVGILNRGSMIGNILSYISFAMFVFIIYRMFSRNMSKRFAENKKYLESTKPIRNRIYVFKMQWKDRKTHRYVKCEKCGTYNRVPKSLGKIKIRCNKCGHEFIKRV